MSNASSSPTKRVLEPNERISEVLFGLIMVLTFTGSLSVAEADRGEVRTMLIGALGCNIAWGLIDGIFYLMGCLSENGRGIRMWQAVCQTANSQEAHQVIADELPPLIADTFSAADYEVLRQKLVQLPAPPPRPRLSKQDWKGAGAVFMWVFLVTFPVTIPFIFMDNLGAAIRVSNGIAVGLLFVSGYAFGRIADYRPWLTGLAMVLLGGVLVALTMALGG